MSRKKSSRSAGRRAETYLRRSINTRDERPRFLIVCEGQRTEPAYFHALKAEMQVNLSIEIEGLGDNTDNLVERTIALKAEGDYTQVWAVFDRDSFPPGRFNRAIQLAENNGIRVAYSNEAFELWFVLHFEFLQTGLPRSDYAHKLTSYLKHPYKKNSVTMYAELKPYMIVGLHHAAKLLENYPQPHPEQDNPSTTVHLLIEEILKHRRP